MKKISLLIVFIASMSYAQTKNVFLDREFWKTNPSVEIIKQKITEGNNPSQLNTHSFDGVSYALIENVNNDAVKYILTQKGNDVNKLTHDGRNYIFWAAYKGNLDMMKHLVEKGSKTDIIDDHGLTVLNFAAYNGQTNPKLYDFLIEKGANPLTEKSPTGANALLMILPRSKDFSMVDYFTKKGLSINSTDNFGNGALNYLAQSGNKAMIEQLLAKGFSYSGVNKKGENAMLLATRGSRRGYNSLDFFKYLEGLGVKPNITSKEGVTPLHNLSNGNKDMPTLNYFIEKGVDINQVDANDNNALINAAGRNSLEVVKLFGEKTTNVNHTNKDGHSALTRALRNSPEVVTYLIEKGADASVVDKKGYHLGYYLLQSYNPEKKEDFKTKLELLTKKGLAFSKPQKNGDNPYHIAIEKNDVVLLDMLKNFKIDVNAKNVKGITPLHKAIMTAKNDKIVKYLLANGADKTIKTDFDETVYDLANENEVLKQKNIDISFLK